MKPNFILLKNKTSVDDEQVQLDSDDRRLGADDNFRVTVTDFNWLCVLPDCSFCNELTCESGGDELVAASSVPQKAGQLSA